MAVDINLKSDSDFSLHNSVNSYNDSEDNIDNNESQNINKQQKNNIKTHLYKIQSDFEKNQKHNDIILNNININNLNNNVGIVANELHT